MKKSKKGFVVSAVLYPLLVLFLAIIMGLLSMTDTRKRILDKMKLEITDNIFDDAACSCDTILAKLNYIIANGVGGSGGDTGSYAYNKLTLNVKTYEAYSDFPVVGNIIGDIAVLSTTPIKNYYVSTSVPKSPQEGTVWIVQDNTSNYYVTSDWNKIGISYVMQYESGKWVLKKSYVYNGESWTMLYYVSLKDGYVDLTSSDINAEITKTYDYTGEYQTFKAVFSGYYKVELWGAQGGSYGSIQGGLGSYTSGEIYLNAGEQLYIYIGQKPDSITGGWNGGGNGYNGSYYGRGGGGATDVRLVPTTEKSLWNEFESLKSRIMVAAGGGGASYYSGGGSYYSYGGAGGGLNGYISPVRGSNGRPDSNQGTGATQSMGGYFSTTPTLYNGGFGYGGASATHVQSEGGGGGYDIGAGGGGSSYISGYEGCNSISSDSTEENIIHTGDAYHYSGYYFENTTMQQNSTIGNGYAEISLIQKNESKQTDKEIKKYNYSFSGINPYSGRYQVFNVPKTGIYKIELWGASGGYYGSIQGGLGAYTSGEISLSKDTKLYIYVGSTISNTYNRSTSGGWNGGGNGYNGSHYGSGGGGATDIRTRVTSSLNTWNENKSLRSRIMVAAGGGGASYYNGGGSYYSYGGAGGGLIGYISQVRGSSGRPDSNQGTGGTQVSGGYLFSSSSKLVGGFGYGAVSDTHSQSEGGGGSGWYGGGGGTDIGAGGGGSSYISGHEGCIGLTSSGASANSTYETYTDSLNNYVNDSQNGVYSFSNTVIIDGAGYPWTTVRAGSSSGMPSYNTSSLITGNTGNGYARITYLGA